MKHMYLDSVGLLTFGVGFRPPLEEYLWLPDMATARADAKAVSADIPAMPTKHYARLCSAYLAQDEIESMLDRKLTWYLKILNATGWQIDAIASNCSVALLDMVYNLGAAKMNSQFVKLKGFVNAKEYKSAASQCHRSTSTDARNAETRQLILSCVG